MGRQAFRLWVLAALAAQGEVVAYVVAQAVTVCIAAGAWAAIAAVGAAWVSVQLLLWLEVSGCCHAA